MRRYCVQCFVSETLINGIVSPLLELRPMSESVHFARAEVICIPALYCRVDIESESMAGQRTCVRNGVARWAFDWPSSEVRDVNSVFIPVRG